MTAYVIFDIDVKDALTYKEYAGLAPATVEAYGGKYLARAGRTVDARGRVGAEAAGHPAIRKHRARAAMAGLRRSMHRSRNYGIRRR